MHRIMLLNVRIHKCLVTNFEFPIKLRDSFPFQSNLPAQHGTAKIKAKVAITFLKICHMFLSTTTRDSPLCSAIGMDYIIPDLLASSLLHTCALSPN